ncbi:MAG: cysteine hydrolase family protein [Bdellovibrio sp.]
MQQSRNNSALILIDVQKGFHDPFWGKRNNSTAEENIQLLLQLYRNTGVRVIHIQHISTNPNSPLRPDQVGVEFMESVAPRCKEKVFQKSAHSAFIGTNLEEYLKEQKIEFLTMVGFTSDHCVSTSARMGADLGFDVTIVSDATVAFQRIDFKGKTFDPDIVHAVSLASLSNEFATIRDTKSIFESLISDTKETSC